ncbi:aminopeptidase N [Actinobacteria bacterium YIM 96077]|uniref:Aminopeptidase N n=1 Tax=Phytoactinopolyspora halophila TaxID=1981511 RepID=A0A329R233_9ACTN|nr:aminopeptidase N [Phytoactinopolyspora halophila]AYY12164.1 aminopeptidase N [Actinobacteria bacterium YIM 96077]RAW18601.1 aminopeptidase N [Phytoactinopolyspora halophila]
MPGTNLTRDEARTRAEQITTSSMEYTVELDLTGDDATFRSTTTLRFQAEKGSRTWLDLIAPAVREVSHNGTDLDPAEVFGESRIQLPPLATTNEVRVVADAAYMRTGEGLHRFVDPVDGETYLYSQFEVADARRVFACFDQPDLKGTFTFVIDAPAHWIVVANSPASISDVREGVRRWSFETTPALSPYVTAVVAGPYHEERDEYARHDATVPLRLFCRRSLAEHLDAGELFDLTKRGFAFYEDVFGLPYPFAKYDQLFVPEFNAGAMENAGAVTYRDDYVFRSRVTDASYERRAEILLHEMAHMWFGDLVTMRWWDDLWLNESFATWASALAQSEATRWDEAWTTFAVTEKLWALRQDQLPSTHPIAADIRDLEDVEVNFDGITYAKGASVLKQLVAWVGREAFLDGVHSYFTYHAWANTTLADLFSHLEETSGRDLATWERQWLQTAGVNTLRPITEVGADGTYMSVVIEQSAAPEHPTVRSHRAAIGLYDLDDGQLTRRRRVELDVTGARTEVADLVGERQPDLLLVNDDDLTFAKIRLDDRSRRTVLTSISTLPSLPRALCWTAATDMLRDAELPTREFVELVLGGIERETSISVVQHVLHTARMAIHLYADPSEPLRLAARWATGLRELAGAAEPGSDAQLAFTRAWVSSAGSEQHVAEIRALLDGSDVLPGLIVDTDLRWHLLQRLAVLGAADDKEIDSELARDNTSTGERHAAYARAAQPTEEAKADAWRKAVESDELPNALLTATIQGFAQPEQRALLRPYVSQYLEAVPRVWAERTIDTAQKIVQGLFPRVLADAETASAVREWLEGADIPDAARRLVAEGLADLDRALQAQACDRSASHS